MFPVLMKNYKRNSNYKSGRIRIITILLCASLITAIAKGQGIGCGIYYEYNAAGGRVKRYYNCPGVVAPYNPRNTGQPPIISPNIGKGLFAMEAQNKNQLKVDLSENNFTIAIYPNPASVQYTITFSKPVKNASYYLSDMTGVIWKKGMISGTEYVENTSRLPAGTYMLSLLIDKKRYNFRIIIVK